MEYNVTLYYNTGYNMINIPDSASLLNQAYKKVVPAIWLLQDYEKSQIKIDGKWEDIEAVDYVSIDNKYYFVTNIEMVNINVALIYLTIDPITTIGLENIGIISGWCTRRHVTDDTPFSNTLSENFQPREVPKTDIFEIEIQDENPYIFTASTVSLSPNKVEAIAKTFIDAATNASVTVPLVSPIAEQTIFNMQTGTSKIYSKQVPNTALYYFSNGGLIDTDTTNAMQIMRSLGLDSALTGCYGVPSQVVGDIKLDWDNDTGISEINSKRLTYTASTLPYKWSDVKNNKVFSGQYNIYTVYGVSSNNSTEFTAGEINNGQSTPDFYVFADLSPEGKTYCRPSVYEGLSGNVGNDIFIAVTEGSQWQNTPVLLTGSSGSALTSIDYSFTKTGNQLNRASDVINGISGVIGNAMKGDVSGAIGGTLNQGFAQGQYELQQQKNKFDFEASTRLVPPEIKFPRSQTLQSYVGNGFYISRSRLSDADTQRYDRYLTQFGYATSEPLTKECFSGRMYFNYVSCTDLNISVTVATPLRIKQKAINMIENGIRIWHTTPSNSAFNNNPII